MSIAPEANSTERADGAVEFNFDWEALTFSTPTVGHDGWPQVDEWDARVTLGATSRVSDPLMASFTELDLDIHLDLGELHTRLRGTTARIDLDSWA